MTAETARDFLAPEQQARIRVADAPVVEGAIAAAVSAETGAPLEEVVRAAEASRASRVQASVITTAIPVIPEERYSRRVTLVNRDGLHARPAAEFVKLAAGFPQRVTVNGKDARSLLGIMSLGLVQGTEIEISAGPDGREAVDALAALVESGFVETGMGDTGTGEGASA